MEKILKGKAASCGNCEGRAVLIESIDDFDKVEAGSIIIVHSSSPAWTVPMLKSGALVSEVGGIICHTAIVAREMGIPCVVGVAGVFEEIQNNDLIRVDGDKGEIYVL